MSYDVVVIGAGPGGYVAAIRSAQLGLKTAVIEREYMGGVCLNVGCIPSKALIHAAKFYKQIFDLGPELGIELPKESVQVNGEKLQAWKQSVCDRMSTGVKGLLKGNKVDIIEGEADFLNETTLSVTKDGKTQEVQSKQFIIATGSRPIELPAFKFDEKDILSSTGGLALSNIPNKLLVIGGGYIGLEIGSFLRKLGSEVTVLEASDDLLKGVADAEAVQVVKKQLKKSGVEICTEAFAQSYTKKGKSFVVTAEVKGQKQEFTCDKVLVTVGRKPNSDQMNFAKAGVELDSKGFVVVNSQRRTSNPNVFAIGDIAGDPMLAHKASHEGVLVAEVIAGNNRVYDAKTVPAVIFTDPEMASAGMTEAEAKANGYDVMIGKFPFAANGKAVSRKETDGFVKMVADKSNHVVLGVTIVGPEASNLISEAVLAIEMGARLEDLALSIHPHPTLGETMMEAAEATLGHAIHVIQRPLKKATGNKATGTQKTLH